MTRRALAEAVISISALGLALLVGAVFILLAHRNPIEAYASLLNGPFGTAHRAAMTLNRTGPLILTGLAVAFAFRGGLFNIGGEGQFLIGGFAAVWAGFAFKAHNPPTVVLLPLVLLCGALAGALYGAIPALLKAKCGVHEVISTIMLNWVARYFVSYLVNHVFLDAVNRNGTPHVALGAMPPLIWGNVRAGIVLAILFAAAVWFVLYRTTLGYEVKAVGYSPLAAEYGGIGITRTMVITMGISGALAGLAGALYYPITSTGPNYGGYFSSSVDFSGRGFDGIAIALIGRNEPIGVAVAALLFGALDTGALMMQLEAEIPREIIQVVQGCIILFMVAPGVVQSLAFWKRWKADVPPEDDLPISGMHLPAPPASEAPE